MIFTGHVFPYGEDAGEKYFLCKLREILTIRE